MKSLKLILNLMLLAVVATACSKKKGGGAAAPAKQSHYYMQNNNCYERDTDKQVDDSYCESNYQGGQCVGYVYYIKYSGSRIEYIDRVRCDQNSLYNECEDPEAYARPGEQVVCEDADYGNSLY